MKKLLTVLLVLAMTIGVVACSKSEETQMSMDELMSIATRITADGLLNEIGGNKAKAQTYIGSTYCVTGHVLEIEEDYVLILGADTGDWNNVIHSDDWYAYASLAMFRVYLPVEDLATLELCDNIVFVGTITDTGTFTYHAIEPIYIDVTNAYLVESGVEYQGRYRL